MDNTIRERIDRFCDLMGYTDITTNGEVLYGYLPDGSDKYLCFNDQFDDYYAVMVLEQRKKEIEDLIEMFKNVKKKK